LSPVRCNVMKLYRYAAFTLLIFLSAPYQFAQSEVCRKKYIAGLEAQAERAHKVLGPDTTDISKAVIYVENTDRGLYFHSNYLSRAEDGKLSENPTKILTNETSDLLTVFDTIVYWSDSVTPDENQVASSALREKVQIYMDSSLFDAGGYPKLNVHGAKHVTVVSDLDSPFRSVPAGDLSVPPFGGVPAHHSTLLPNDAGDFIGSGVGTNATAGIQ